MEVAPRTTESWSPVIVAESPEHADALERVLDAAFGPGRFAKTSERVREKGAVRRLDLSRVALGGGEAIGCCRIYDISVGGRPAFFLGPLAVAPSRRNVGLGALLVGAAIEACAKEDKLVLVVGPARFFEPFGFRRVSSAEITMPGPVNRERFLWRAPQSGGCEGLSGAVSAPRVANQA